MPLLPEQIAIIEKHLGRVPPSDPPTIYDAIAVLPRRTRNSVRLARPQRFFDCRLRLRIELRVGARTCFVFGYLVVDRSAVREGRAEAIVQDMLAFYPDDATATYYSGGRADSSAAKHIAHDFCETFGGVVPEAFGCRRVGRTWDMRNHRYADEHDPRLPGEPVNRELFAFGMQRVRAEEGLT